ncbi:MAG: hypothetical protein AAF569_08160, partial [Pseudomonadota bacterium]
MTPNLSSHYLKPEKDCVHSLISALDWNEQRAKKVSEDTADFIAQVRNAKRKSTDLESFFQHYGLDTEEGLALMSMAEALLRIPDTPTATALIRDKIAATNW